MAVDLWLLRTRLITRRVFWVAYLIVLAFQLITNGMLTGLGVVHYDPGAIVGGEVPVGAVPPFLGSGRIAFAPVEDLAYGFGLILLTMSGWIWLGRRGVQREPAGRPAALARLIEAVAVYSGTRVVATTRAMVFRAGRCWCCRRVWSR